VTVGQTALAAVGLLRERLTENTSKLPTVTVLESSRMLLDALGFTPQRVGTPLPGMQVNVQVNTVPASVLSSAREKLRAIEGSSQERGEQESRPQDMEMDRIPRTLHPVPPLEAPDGR